MAKALGLIGNFKGKLGNTVGYSLKDSNNKQTQGVRVYQPVVRNPKTAAQAEQRAKLAPINATYRALKMVIDRGQEGKAYGNKSRLAWLSDAMKAFKGGWFEKGAVIKMPALVPLTKGSLAVQIPVQPDSVSLSFECAGVSQATTNTLGALSIALLAAYPALAEGDQLTFVQVDKTDGSMLSHVESIVLDKTSKAALPSWLSFGENLIFAFNDFDSGSAAAVVVSREGNNGAHLRSTTTLDAIHEYDTDTFAPTAKEAAIESYMSQGANTDWAEESLM